jgi:hypothetical protein
VASAADRYRAVVDEVAADLGISPGDDLAETVAALRLMRQHITARLLRSDVLRADPDDLLRVDAALRQYQPERKSPQFNIKFVEGVSGTFRCSACGEQNTVAPGTYTPAERPKPFRFRCECGRGTEFSASGPFTDGGDPGKPITPAPEPEATPNGVRYREGVSASAFHAAVLRNNEIPPLKKEQPAIGADVSPSDTVAGLWRNDRHPYRNRDVAHRLPAVNGKG